MSDAKSGYRYKDNIVRYNTKTYNNCSYSSDHIRFACVRTDDVKERVMTTINSSAGHIVTVNDYKSRFVGCYESHFVDENHLRLTTENSSILDYKSPSSPVKIENSLLLIIEPESRDSPLRDYLNCFIARLHGSFWVTHAHNIDNDLIIINKPMFGLVRLHVLTESAEHSFYVQYERTEEGKLSGELIRARAIPFHEAKKEGEYEDFRYGVPVYISYYSPLSGQRIKREDYFAYLQACKEVISLYTLFPSELCTLLGYL